MKSIKNIYKIGQYKNELVNQGKKFFKPNLYYAEIRRPKQDVNKKII